MINELDFIYFNIIILVYELKETWKKIKKISKENLNIDCDYRVHVFTHINTDENNF